MAESKTAMAAESQGNAQAEAQPQAVLPLQPWFGRGDAGAENTPRNWFSLTAVAEASGIDDTAIRMRVSRRRSSMADPAIMIWRPKGLHLRALKQRGLLRKGKAREAMLLSRECIEQVVPELDLHLLPEETGVEVEVQVGVQVASESSADSFDGDTTGLTSGSSAGAASGSSRKRARDDSGGTIKHTRRTVTDDFSFHGNNGFDPDLDAGWDGDFGDDTVAETMRLQPKRNTGEGEETAVAASSANTYSASTNAFNLQSSSFVQPHVQATPTVPWFPPLPPGSPPPLPPLLLDPPPSVTMGEFRVIDSTIDSPSPSAFTRVVPANDVQVRDMATGAQPQSQSQTLTQAQQLHASFQPSPQFQQSSEMQVQSRLQPPPQLQQSSETQLPPQQSLQSYQLKLNEMQHQTSMQHQQSPQLQQFTEAQVQQQRLQTSPQQSLQLEQSNAMQHVQQSTIPQPHESSKSSTPASQSPPSKATPLTLQWKEDALIALSRVYTPKAKQNNVQRVARALVRTGKAGKRSGTQNTRCTNADLVALKVFHEVDAPVEGMKSTVMRAQIQMQGDDVWRREAKKIKFRGDAE